MSVSIVIPHYGPSELTVACLASLREHTPRDVEVIVVNNGTGDLFPADVRLANPENRGFAIACNQGARAASHDRVVFLNNDTEVRAGWLPPLVAALDGDPLAAVVGSLLVYPDGRIQHAGVELFYAGGGILTARNIQGPQPRGEVDAVTGACMAVERAHFLAIGGFDEGYWNGYEDVDLCLALREEGWRVLFEPDSVVMHRESASGPARWLRVTENIARLQVKWAGVGVGRT